MQRYSLTHRGNSPFQKALAPYVPSSHRRTSHFYRRGFASSPVALERLEDRAGSKVEPRHRQPHPVPGRHESAPFARSAATGHTLRAQASRRSYPLRYQAPGSHRQARPSHHGDRTRQTRGPGYEISLRRHRRSQQDRLTAIMPDQKHGSVICFFHMARALQRWCEKRIPRRSLGMANKNWITRLMTRDQQDHTQGKHGERDPELYVAADGLPHVRYPQVHRGHGRPRDRRAIVTPC
jgi:hypothetical protein